MSEINLGIIGGGQLGSLLSVAAKKLNIKTTIYSDDPDALHKILVMILYLEIITIKKKF